MVHTTIMRLVGVLNRILDFTGGAQGGRYYTVIRILVLGILYSMLSLGAAGEIRNPIVEPAGRRT